MKYLKVNCLITGPEDTDCTMETATDILSGLLVDMGYETFETTSDGLAAYIQDDLYDEDSLSETISLFPLVGWDIQTSVEEAEYANWNEQWEQEGFEPIIIGSELCVHAQHHTHLPGTDSPLPATRYELLISPRLAFGSGTHPTTRQLLEVLLQLDLEHLHVIDAGCGTGILGMLSLLRGADKVSAYDIDEWSTENTRDNAILNNLEIAVYKGDASVLPQIVNQQGMADLLIANINRNILFSDMPSFVKSLRPKTSRLLLSGFYEEDVPYLIEKAKELGLHEIMRLTRDGWCVLMFNNFA